MITCMDYKPARRFRNHTIIEGQCHLNIMPSHQEHNEMCDNCLKNWHGCLYILTVILAELEISSL